MRYAIPVVAFLFIHVGAIQGQEVVPLPTPDPLPTLQPAPLPLVAPGSPSILPPAPPTPPVAAVPPGPPPVAYPPPVYGPPPPVMYGPPPLAYRRRAFNADPAGNPNLWLDVESLIWWSKGQPLAVPLLTTGPGSQGATAGNIGAPGTTSLNRPLDYGAGGGVRLTLGAWCDPEHVWGLEGNLFSLGRQTTGFGVSDHSQAGNFVINEPVVGAPFVTQVSAPGVQTGAASVDASTELWGAEVNGFVNILRRDGWTVNLLAGFRYLGLEERLNVTANSALFTTTTYTDNLGNTLATAPPGSTVTVVDQFGVRNQFYGGQVGARAQYMAGRWSLAATGTLALGGVQSSTTVDGSTNVYPSNGPPVYLAGGNYATLQTGRYGGSHFAAVPAMTLNLGYQLTPFIRATVGYNVLCISSVVRPGNQIDNTFDGNVHPLVPMTTSSFWAQGLNLGVQVSF